LGYRLNWQPLPVLQSYSAYTSWLDKQGRGIPRFASSAFKADRAGGLAEHRLPLPQFPMKPKTALQIFCRYKPYCATSNTGSSHVPVTAARDRNRSRRYVRPGGQTIHVPTPPGSRWLVIGKILGDAAEWSRGAGGSLVQTS